MERTCRGCSTPITPHPRERAKRIWCSEKCRYTFHRRANNPPYVKRYDNSYAPRSSISHADCHECGELFTVRRKVPAPDVACYKTECQKRRAFRRSKAHRERFKAEHGYPQKGERNIHPGACIRCGEHFVSRKGSMYCTKACWNAVIAEKYANSCGGRGANRTRKLRERNAKIAPVNRKKIFERDRWRCHLCGNKINQKLKSPHPQSATIDHLIPLAVGGTHEPANVSAAHRFCNMSKGDRGGGEQLMLVG